jgi:hypothetical protein
LRVVMSLYTQNGAKDDSVKKSTDIVCICQSSKYRTDLISSYITTFNNYSQSPWQSVTGQALISTETQLLEVSFSFRSKPGEQDHIKSGYFKIACSTDVTNMN